MDAFQTYSPLLFAIAYRMLGSASDAEDIVQEAWLRYAAAQERVQTPKTFLTTVVTHLCLDELKSARVRREAYPGPWLPEPLLTEAPAATPLDTLEQRESISLAFLVLLERLTPEERAVFLLHEVFEYPYAEIAAILGKSAAACRQIGHRAGERLAAGRARFTPAPDAQRQLTERFLAACTTGDLPGLTALLAEDVTVWADGGGRVAAARRPVTGRDPVSRFILGLVRKAPPDLRVAFAEVNGALAMLAWTGGALTDVYTFEIAAGRIAAVRVVRNPDKLAYLARQWAARPPAP